MEQTTRAVLAGTRMMLHSASLWHEGVPDAALAVQRCAEAERSAPLLEGLSPHLANKELVASELAVERFEGLLAAHGGARERERWANLRALLRIVPVPSCDGGRVATLEGLEEHNRAVLAVSEELRALTVTANGHLIRKAAAQGVRLPVYIHRAHYLTGQ